MTKAPQVTTEKTNMTGGGNSSRTGNGGGTPVYEYHFQFELDDTIHEDRSYTTGRRNYRKGSQVEYLASSPSRCRLKKARSSNTGWPAIFVILFPTAGACCFLAGMRARRGTLNILKHGKMATGRVMSSSWTSWPKEKGLAT